MIYAHVSWMLLMPLISLILRPHQALAAQDWCRYGAKTWLVKGSFPQRQKMRIVHNRFLRGGMRRGLGLARSFTRATACQAIDFIDKQWEWWSAYTSASVAGSHRQEIVQTRVSSLRRKHPNRAMQPQMAEAWRRHNLSLQPDGVGSNISEIKQWLCEVPTHERGALSSLRIEAPKVVIEERQWHATATQMTWSAAGSCQRVGSRFGSVSAARILRA